MRSPKVYVRDSGLLHALLNLPTQSDLENHPKAGASWEGFIIDQILQQLEARPDECYFWRTHTGAELDLLVVRGRRRHGFEVKRTTRARHHALHAFRPERSGARLADRDSRGRAFFRPREERPRLELEIKIAQLKYVEGVSEVVVSSDSPLYGEIALNAGALFLRRPEELCGDGSMTPSYRWMAERMECDYVLMCNCTSPLLSTGTIAQVIQNVEFLKSRWDSANTVTRVHKHLWRTVLDPRDKSRSGRQIMIPANYSAQAEMPRGQDLSKFYELTRGANLIARELMVELSNPVGRDPFFVEVPQLEAVDIDTMLDFRVAEALYLGLV